MRKHPADLDEATLMAASQLARTRGSGPGGQRRNKVETGVTITHRPTGLQGAASERARPADNHRVAVFRLRVNLALSVRCPIGQGYRPSDLWQSRCIHGHVSVNSNHRDFPALLAEALDVLAAHKFDVPVAATELRCTASQLTKLLKQEPRGLAMINQERAITGKRPLR